MRKVAFFSSLLLLLLISLSVTSAARVLVDGYGGGYGQNAGGYGGGYGEIAGGGGGGGGEISSPWYNGKWGFGSGYGIGRNGGGGGGGGSVSGEAGSAFKNYNFNGRN